MCGSCWCRWAGVVSGPRAGRWNGTSPPSVTGRRSLGRALKKAQKERRTIVFLDESGLSQRPHRCHTPVLQYHFNWKTLSVIAGITLWNFYFRLFPGAIRAPQVVAFLKHLLRHIPGKLLLVWDRLPAHRSRLVQDFVASQNGRIHMEYLPAYAPELNPTEYIWGHCKHHKLANACPKDFAQLKLGARGALRNMRRRPTLITAFWKQASLWPE